MKSMNLCLSFAFAVLTLFAANSVHAYYNPQTGRWLSADPVAEPGFQALQDVEKIPRNLNFASLRQGRFLIREVVKGKESPNPYLFVVNDPGNKIDPLGLDVVNNSDLAAWVFISGSGPGTGWIVIQPGGTVTGDTDMICPNTGSSTKGPDGKYRCLKIIDCYNATISGAAPGPYAISPVYAGQTSGRGNNFSRRCCCALAACAAHYQKTEGGSVNPLTVAPGLPPDYPP